MKYYKQKNLIFLTFFIILLIESIGKVEALENDIVIQCLEKNKIIDSYLANIAKRYISKKKVINREEILLVDLKKEKILYKEFSSSDNLERVIHITPEEVIIYYPKSSSYVSLPYATKANLISLDISSRDKLLLVSKLLGISINPPFSSFEELEFIGIASVGNTPCYYFEGKYKFFQTSDIESQAYNAKFWVDLSNCMIRKWILLDKGGSEFFKRKVTKLNLNIIITPKNFHFMLPKNIQVIDNSDYIIKHIKLIIQNDK